VHQTILEVVVVAQEQWAGMPADQLLEQVE
jgi:hypothetical protein